MSESKAKEKDSGMEEIQKAVNECQARAKVRGAVMAQSKEIADEKMRLQEFLKAHHDYKLNKGTAAERKQILVKAFETGALSCVKGSEEHAAATIEDEQFEDLAAQCLIGLKSLDNPKALEVRAFIDEFEGVKKALYQHKPNDAERIIKDIEHQFNALQGESMEAFKSPAGMEAWCKERDLL